MIVTGTSTSEVIVETKIEGGGETYTRIETEVNGKKQVFETDEPGKYEIKLESSPTVSPSPEPLASPSPSPSPTPAPAPATLINRIRQTLMTLLSRLFRF